MDVGRMGVAAFEAGDIPGHDLAFEGRFVGGPGAVIAWSGNWLGWRCDNGRRGGEGWRRCFMKSDRSRSGHLDLHWLFLRGLRFLVSFVTLLGYRLQGLSLGLLRLGHCGGNRLEFGQDRFFPRLVVDLNLWLRWAVGKGVWRRHRAGLDFAALVEGEISTA